MLGITKDNSKENKTNEKKTEMNTTNETNWDKVRAEWLKVIYYIPIEILDN